MTMSLLPTNMCRTRLLLLVLHGAFLSLIGLGMTGACYRDFVESSSAVWRARNLGATAAWGIVCLVGAAIALICLRQAIKPDTTPDYLEGFGQVLLIEFVLWVFLGMLACGQFCFGLLMIVIPCNMFYLVTTRREQPSHPPLGHEDAPSRRCTER